MEARDLFLQQHAAVHSAAVGGNKMSMAERTFGGLGDAQMRVRPREDLNSLAWLMFHIARADRIRSARCRGVNDWGAGPGAGTVAPDTGCAHSIQNLAASGRPAPQDEQRRASGVAHSRQNLARGGFSVRQAGQFISHSIAVISLTQRWRRTSLTCTQPATDTSTMAR